MPSVAELDRLQGLVTRLVPLTTTQTGELIKSDDWNTVVGALLETARAVVASASEAVPAHEHPDQVALGWLDPRLRQLVQQGPLGDPAAVARIDALERRVDRMRGSLDALRDDVAKLRDLITEVSTRDLAREAAVSTLHRTLDGIADARQDVLDVRATMRALQVDVSAASAAVASLRVNGHVVDVADLASRVDRADELRARLTLPTGELLDTAELSKQLATLEHSLVTQQQLDDALEAHRAVLSGDDRAALEDSLRTGLLDDLQAAGKQLSDSVDARVGERLAGIEGQVARAVSDATPGLSASVLGTLRPELAAAAKGAVDEAGAAAAMALGEATDGLRSELGGQIAGVLDTLGGRVADEVGRRLPAQLEAISGRVDGIEGRFAPVEERLAAQEAESSKLDGRFDDLALQEAKERDALESKLLGALDERVAGLDNGLAELGDSTRTLLDSRLAEAAASELEAARGLVSELEARLPALVDARIEPATDALRTEFAGQIEEAVKSVTASVDVDVSKELAPLEQSLSALDARLTPVESRLADDTATLSALDARLTPVESTVAAQDKALSALGGRLTPLESRVGAAEASLGSLAGRLAPLETTVASQQEALTALDSRLTPVETQLAAVTSTMVTKDALATQLAQTSAALHADMTTAAQTEVAKLRADLPSVVRSQLSAPVNASLIQTIAARRIVP